MTRSRRLQPPTDNTAALWQAARELLGRVQRRTPVRLLGVAAGELERADQGQADLFAAGSPQRAVDTLADAVRDRFGAGALRRAGTLRGRG